MSAARIVVFRFDRDPLICRSRVALLRALNPGVPIHGLYGAGPGWRSAVHAVLGRRLLGLDGLFLSAHDGQWNWRHGDLALVDWFRRVGRRLEFDVLHLVEWDLVLTTPLELAYAHVPPSALGLTALETCAALEGRWEWLDRPGARAEYAALRRHADSAWGAVPEPRACLGPGPCLPREFLERYAALDVPELCNDELRLPLAGEALGFELVENGFMTDRFEAAQDPCFNVGGRQVPPRLIEEELSRPGGRQVFHPVRDPLRFSRWRS